MTPETTYTPATQEPALPTNEIQINEILDTALKELNELNTCLNEILDYSAKLDQSFEKAYTTLEKFATDYLPLADEKTLLNPRTKEDEAKANATLLAGGALLAFRGLGAIVSDLSRRENLDKLLKFKQEVAADKRPVVEKMIPRTVKNIERYEIVINYLLNQTYNINGSNSDSSDESLMKDVSRMKNVMRQYRTTYYIYLAYCFLGDEYQAWLDGKHNSDTQSPNMLDVNDQIMKIVLFPDCAAEFGKPHDTTDDEGNYINFDEDNNKFKDEIDTVSQEIASCISTGALTGRVMFVMADDTLMAYYLSNCNNVAHINCLLSNGMLNNRFQKILENNEAVKTCEPYFNEHAKIMKKGLGYGKWLFVYILLGIVLALGCWDIETTWLKWTLLVGCELFVCYRALKRYFSCQNKFAKKLEYVNSKARDCMLLHAGNTPRMEKVDSGSDSIWVGVILGGLIGFIFIPIPGGLIIGALVGAGLVSLAGKDNHKEIDKSLQQG